MATVWVERDFFRCGKVSIVKGKGASEGGISLYR